MSVTGDPRELRRQDGLVVPGVGAFAACMASLRQAGGVELIREWAETGRALLGICVGHQVLFDGGVEHGEQADGVGLYSGVVSRLEARRLPHMGWNTVTPPEGSRLFAGIESERFYFVHSYAATAASGLVTHAEHDGFRFVAAVERAAVCSTQFHPEKSGAAGAKLIANWLDQVG